MAEKRRQLTCRQRIGVRVLLEHQTVSAAAQASSIPERTLRSWLKLPHFASAMEESARQSNRHANLRMARLTDKAVSVLDRVMDGPAGDPRTLAVQARAAAVVLAHARDLELVEIRRDLEWARRKRLEEEGNG